VWDDEVIDLSAMVAMPRTDDPRIRHREIRHFRLVVPTVELPVRSPDLRELAAFVGIDLKIF